MTEIIVAFITGLTTGGLSCLAVQGGLLAGSLANQVEKDVNQATIKGAQGRPRLALPILLFLAGKLAAYTLLGFALGALGSLIQLSPLPRAVLQIAIGVFMIGNALRMFDVHPVFRYFSFEPPRAVTRAVRRLSKNGADTFTPVLLGVMTVLIPCGVTQAMMAASLGSGSAAFGAALMFAFTLGTTPTFFALAYSAAKLGTRLERFFLRGVAVVLLVLGLFSVEAGLNLMGSPFTAANLASAFVDQRVMGASETAGPASPQALNPPVTVDQPPPQTAPADGAILLQALNDGYQPQTLHAPANTPLILNVVTENTRSCSRAFVIPGLNVQVILPESGTTPIEIPAQDPGTTMRFACSMGMYTGEILFE